jgi:AcrR family transcriptional regulator
MTAKFTQEANTERRETILLAARWCFLNFGFSKTSLDDIAKRANISRTLLYKNFKDKEDIFTAVFEHWLVSRHPAAQDAARRQGAAYERLRDVCRVMLEEPWKDMFGAPMSGDFYDVCERLNPEVANQHKQLAVQCFALIIGDQPSAEVFLLALDGMLADNPTPALLGERIELLVQRFTPAAIATERQ